MLISFLNLKKGKKQMPMSTNKSMKRFLCLLLLSFSVFWASADEYYRSNGIYAIMTDNGQFIEIYFNLNGSYKNTVAYAYLKDGDTYTMTSLDGKIIILKQEAADLVDMNTNLRFINISSNVNEKHKAMNVLSINTSIAFFSVTYELKINDNFSFVLESGYGNSFLMFYPGFIVNGIGRWYPWNGSFFVGIGLGYEQKYIVDTESRHSFLEIKGNDGQTMRRDGFMFSLGAGWQIDLGKKDGLILPINLGIRWMTGPNTMDNLNKDITPYAMIGIGYAF
jgi:hypothetical protein